MSYRILYLGFQPREGQPLFIDEELQELRRRLNASSFGAEWQVEERRNASFDALPGLILRGGPTVLHIASHGEPGGRLVLPVNGAFRAYAPQEVAEVIGACSARIIFLNACFSVELAQLLVEKGFAVLGSTARVPSGLAGRFAAVFYELLAEGCPANQAFSSAQASVMSVDSAHALTYRLLHPPDVELPHFPPAPPSLTASVLENTNMTGPQPNQVAIFLDAYPAEMQPFLDQLSPFRHERLTLRLSEYMRRYGLPPFLHGEPYPDWKGLAEAMSALCQDALRAFQGEDCRKDYYIGGQAPHALFAHLGFALSNWAGKQVLIHRTRSNGQWMAVDLEKPSRGARFFDTGAELDRPSASNGAVALYLSAQGGGVHPGVEALFKDRPFAGTVARIHTRQDPNDPSRISEMEASDVVNAAVELQATSSDVASNYPSAKGLSLFVYGPDFLAFLAARALNPRQLSQGIGLTYFEQQQYKEVYRLPLPENREPRLPEDAESRNVRLRVYNHLLDGIEAMRRSVDVADFDPPKGFTAMQPDLCKQLHRHLMSLEPGRAPEGDVFELDAPRRILKLGEGLLHAIQDFSEDDLHRFGRLLVLHELAHHPQKLRGSSYQGIGRAAVVLEDVDYWADAFAQQVALAWELREGGPKAVREAGANLRKNLVVHLRALAAFDRIQQGSPLPRLAERRLRRYLIWGLQAARAETIHQPADIRRLLGERLFVELAPLPGRLDGRGEKLVEEDAALAPGLSPHIFVSIGGRVQRIPDVPQNFSAIKLVEAVRNQQDSALVQQLRYVVDSAEALLAPWT